jgi:ELWxxDGT repeat protein
MEWQAGLVAGLLAIATGVAPATADDGLHLVAGQVRANGCASLEVWDGDQLVQVVEPPESASCAGECGAAPGVPWTCAYMDVAHQQRLGEVLYFDWLHTEEGLNGISGARHDSAGEVWVSDGTPEGTRALFGVRDGAGKWVQYCADDWYPASTRSYVWSGCYESSGPSGVPLLAGLHALTGSTTDAPSLPVVNPRRFTVAGEGLFFTDADAAHGRELWVTRPTLAGTRMVTDIRAGRPGSQPMRLTPVHPAGSIRFTADDGSGRAW